jgi:hypothetical protein
MVIINGDGMINSWASKATSFAEGKTLHRSGWFYDQGLGPICVARKLDQRNMRGNTVLLLLSTGAVMVVTFERASLGSSRRQTSPAECFQVS